MIAVAHRHTQLNQLFNPLFPDKTSDTLTSIVKALLQSSFTYLLNTCIFIFLQFSITVFKYILIFLILLKFIKKTYIQNPAGILRYNYEYIAYLF